jgi:hypothetical protein
MRPVVRNLSTIPRHLKEVRGEGFAMGGVVVGLAALGGWLVINGIVLAVFVAREWGRSPSRNSRGPAV